MSGGGARADAGAGARDTQRQRLGCSSERQRGDTEQAQPGRPHPRIRTVGGSRRGSQHCLTVARRQARSTQPTECKETLARAPGHTQSGTRHNSHPHKGKGVGPLAQHDPQGPTTVPLAAHTAAKIQQKQEADRQAGSNCMRMPAPTCRRPLVDWEAAHGCAMPRQPAKRTPHAKHSPLPIPTEQKSKAMHQHQNRRNS